MFTVRVDRGQKREVFACARYIVTYEADGRARITLVGMPDGSPNPEPQDLVVERGECAFVMNGAGITCDVVRPVAARAG
jgi:hypothetical protein